MEGASWHTMIDVALDTRETTHMSVGMRQYAHELAERLPRVAPDLRFGDFGHGDNFDWAEQVGIPFEILRLSPRLVHFLSPFAPIAVPAPYVVTIHDLIDLNYPQWTKRKAHWYFANVVRYVARKALCVITDDEATALDLERYYGLPRERIAIVPLGVDLPPVEPVRRPASYVIYAGNRRPHKDLRTILEAWNRVDERLELDLVLTGEVDAAFQSTRDRGRIIFLGELTHDDVLRWIAGASALVHAALREGFGLPLLEASRLGTPVICAQTAVPDVLREHVATFAAGDGAALASAIEAVLRGEGDTRARKARNDTSVLTWDRCAEATAAVYRRFL
jgi:glycosyltransferase involved in cell wall biosynthesis